MNSRQVQKTNEEREKSRKRKRKTEKETERDGVGSMAKRGKNKRTE